MLIYSAAFTSAIVGATFDAAIVASALNGSVNPMLISAVLDEYKLDLSDKPATFIQQVNDKVLTDKKGYKPALAQALHAACTAIVVAGKVKKLPVVRAMPAWANAEKLAEKAKESAAKRAVTKQAKVDAEAKAKATAPAFVPLTDEDCVLYVISLILDRKVTAETEESLRMALAMAVPAPV